MAEPTVNINVVARELDPSKVYVIEVRKDSMPMQDFHSLCGAIRNLGVKFIAVVSDTGDDINVIEIPEVIA